MSKIITLTDPITGESVYPITSAETVISSSGSTVESALGKLEEDKQDKITDLEDIRNKANSAVQSEDLANVAFSGSYNDLSNKPAIPDAITEEDVAGWGFTKNTGTITEIKMNGSSKGTSGTVNLGNIVTKVKINGSEKTPTSGVVDLGTVITEHQDISGKLDKTEAADTYLTKTDASNTYLGKTAKAASATKADSATKATQDASGNTITATYATKNELDGKVDKDGNKQLSEEDFTLALKQKLEGLNNYDDTEISEAINQLREDFDALVDGDSSTAIKTFNEIIAFLEGIEDSEDLSSIISAIEQQIAAKQDKINDLDDIRTNAAKGKTSVQKVKINGTEKTPNTSGVVDLGTVITSHQDISGKLDKTEASSTYLTKTDASNTYLGKNDKAASASTADKATQDGNGNTITATYATKTELNNKVDKVSGKGLSTNDFTDEDKRILGTIEEGAKVNVQSDWNETDEASDAFIKNKPVIPEIPEIPNIPDNILGSVDIDEFIDDSSLGEYATKGYVDDSIRDAEENFATKDYVDEALSNIKLPEINDSAELMVNVTYDELVTLRDNSQLVPGQKYRMTDYETMTSIVGTQSAGHPFDLILTALDVNILDENCSAIYSIRDTEGYFSKNKLESWTIKYCLDNDSSRFVWAVNPGNFLNVLIADLGGTFQCNSLNTTVNVNDVTYHSWVISLEGRVLTLLTESAIPSIGDIVYYYIEEYDLMLSIGVSQGITQSTEKGKGVIYRLIDEHFNDVHYDFKNIMYTRKVTDGTYDPENGVDTFVYTFNEIDEDGIYHDSTVWGTLHSNHNIIEFSKSLSNNIFFGYCYNNSISTNSSGNTFDRYCTDNNLGQYAVNNTFGYSITYIKAGDYFTYNTIKNYCSNSVFGNFASENILENSVNRIICGDDFSYNVFEQNSWNNTFGDDCSSNVFGTNFIGNTVGNEFTGNTIGQCGDCIFGSGFHDNEITASISRCTFGTYCYENKISSAMNYVVFGQGCYHITIPTNFRLFNSTFGNNCCYIEFSNPDEEYVDFENITFDNGCRYLKIASLDSEAYDIYNYHFTRGLIGLYDSPLIITLAPSRNYETKVAKNSNGEIVTYCEADLIN